MGVLLTHVSECHISEHVELTRTCCQWIEKYRPI